jgi:hypothetical protein
MTVLLCLLFVVYVLTVCHDSSEGDVKYQLKSTLFMVNGPDHVTGFDVRYQLLGIQNKYRGMCLLHLLNFTMLKNKQNDMKTFKEHI